jgi:hypothetical protein
MEQPTDSEEIIKRLVYDEFADLFESEKKVVARRAGVRVSSLASESSSDSKNRPATLTDYIAEARSDV